MGDLIIACPRTKKRVDTGVSMPIETFKASSLSGNDVKCPHCGETHFWCKEDAVVVGHSMSRVIPMGHFTGASGL
jgi:hypothetical protein